MKIGRKLADALDYPPAGLSLLPRPETSLDAISSPSVKKRKASKPSDSVIVGGTKYPLVRDPRSKVWSIRKRSGGSVLYHNLGVVDRDVARDKAREYLGKVADDMTRRGTGRATLREVCDAYLAMPKRVSAVVAEMNVGRLQTIVRDTWGKTLEETTTGQLEKGRLWEDYAAKRQGGKLDLSTRRHENRGINSAIRCASSIFHEGLRDGYERAGISMDWKAVTRITWVPEIRSKIPMLAPDAEPALMAALAGLKDKDRLKWRAIMLARFAGLRAKEIRHARRDWLTKDPTTGTWRIELRDRPEDGFAHKTGADYAAPILSQELVDDLLTLPDGLLVPTTGSPDHFYKVACNTWLRQFIPRPNKGLHRLRALYLDHLRSAVAGQILADQAGVKAAQQAAGHTSSRTTTGYYLSQPQMPS